ncbi:retrotransposon protein, putative, ty1-copia subclass [Tanacetum coccineum]
MTPCHNHKEVGHCKRNCPAYLAELFKKKKQVGTASSLDIFIIELFSFPTKSWVYDTSCGTHICNTKHGLGGVRKLKQVEAIGSFDLVLPNDLVICLDNCHYVLSIIRGVVSVHRLVENGFVYTKRFKHYLDSTYLWHYRLAHINKKRIKRLQQEGLLKSIDDESFDQCESCLSGKMTKKPFSYSNERAKDLLGIIHTDKRLLSQEISGRAVDLEEIQEEEDTTPSEITSNIPMEVEGFEPPQPPQEEVIPICRMFFTVVDIRAIRILISIVEYYDYKIWKMDIKTAFLNGYLDEDIYMVQPEGFVDPNHPRKVCKLQRSIYGLKQASRSWNKRFDEEIKRFGFAQNLDEPCGKRHLFLESKSIEIDRKGLDLNKSKGAKTAKEVNHMKNVPYASVVGSIMYVVRCTRPDVAFAQNMTSRFQQNPGELHWTAVKNILKYLRNTKDMLLVYGGNPNTELRVECYCNAGFETDIDDMKSLIGYVSF